MFPEFPGGEEGLGRFGQGGVDDYCEPEAAVPLEDRFAGLNGASLTHAGCLEVPCSPCHQCVDSLVELRTDLSVSQGTKAPSSADECDRYTTNHGGDVTGQGKTESPE